MNNTYLNPQNFKLKTASREQFEFRQSCLDQLVPDDHKVRLIWDFVDEMDLSICLDGISSFYGGRGRPSIDPKILLTLWIYTIIDGNASARKLEELCLNHDVYKWICGGVSISRTVLAEFRSVNPRKFEELLTNCLAVMLKNNLISDTDFAQDGTRIKANAGMNTFRRENSLKELQSELSEHIDFLRNEEKKAPNAYEKRKALEKTRRAIEKKDKIKVAIKNLEQYRCEKIENGTRNHNKPTQKELEDVRVSTTDPEVRKMKMGDGGYRLAYNVQFATGLDSRVIYGVDVVNTLDPGTAPRLMAQVNYRLQSLKMSEIKKWIADAAYSAKNDLITIANLFPNCLFFAPPKPHKQIDPKKHLKNDHAAVVTWRNLIGSNQINELYKKRCSTAEFSNMHVKNQALTEFFVRGLVKVKGKAFLHAISMNISRAIDLFQKKLKGVNL